jgi:acyl carrier protein
MQESVFEIISQVMDVPLEEINGQSSPDTIGSWDSLNHMNLVFALEEEYGVKFSDEAIVKMLDVESILKELNEFSSGAEKNA